MDTSGCHRKIELQDPEDLAYLVANVRRAATGHLDEAFPHIQGREGEEDGMRNRIEDLVEEYIARTFEFAAPNLAINGMPVSSIASFLDKDASSGSVSLPQEEVYEPFDGRKRQRVIDLAAEEEDLLRDIAALKRRVPREAAARFADSARIALRSDEEALSKRVQDSDNLVRMQVGGSGSGRRRKSVGPGAMASPVVLDASDPTMDGREDEVRKEFTDAVEGLARLKREMPAVVAKMDRARVAGEYVFTKGR